MNIKTITPKPRHIPFILLAVVAIILSVGLVLTLMQTEAPASSGNIYVEQPSASAKKDETVKFAVRISPGANIDTVTATAEYDKNRLRYDKTEYTDSPFSSQIPATTSEGKVTVQAAKLGGETVSSDAFIATVTFTALESGSQTLKLVDGNAAHAGIATNPTVEGKTIVRSASTTTSGSSTVDSSTAESDENESPVEKIADTLASPISSLLESMGIAPDTAKHASLWIVGLLVCGIIAAVVAIIIILRKKKQSKKQPKTPQQGASL